MSCRATNGISPGVNALPPVNASRIGRDPAAPYSGPYGFCDYCTMVHKDAHVQSMYPLTPAQHQGAEMHRDSPVAYAGMPSALWTEGVQQASQEHQGTERRPVYAGEAALSKDHSPQCQQMPHGAPANKGF